jgi:hypothetical protein
MILIIEREATEELGSPCQAIYLYDGKALFPVTYNLGDMPAIQMSASQLFNLKEALRLRD